MNPLCQNISIHIYNLIRIFQLLLLKYNWRGPSRALSKFEVLKYGCKHIAKQLYTSHYYMGKMIGVQYKVNPSM